MQKSYSRFKFRGNHATYIIYSTLIFMAKGVYKPRSEKIRLLCSPPLADSLSLSMPDWSVDITKFTIQNIGQSGY